MDIDRNTEECLRSKQMSSIKDKLMCPIFRYCTVFYYSRTSDNELPKSLYYLYNYKENLNNEKNWPLQYFKILKFNIFSEVLPEYLISLVMGSE